MRIHPRMIHRYCLGSYQFTHAIPQMLAQLMHINHTLGITGPSDHPSKQEITRTNTNLLSATKPQDISSQIPSSTTTFLHVALSVHHQSSPVSVLATIPLAHPESPLMVIIIGICYLMSLRGLSSRLGQKYLQSTYYMG